MRKFLSVILLTVLLQVSFAQDKKYISRDNNVTVTEQKVKIGNTVLSYTVTTGYMQIRDENDSLKARLFFVAYTKNDEPDASKRPIMFAYNGGPGSASVWLHMGALGPKRVLMTEKGDAISPPYKYVDNEYTWLDKTDIVFIDPMMTGYTRPAGKNDKGQFTGYENDIQFVGDFIRLYTTKYERWSSPKLIGGESYGTTRSAGLAGYLQNRWGLYINGVILISAVLDFATLDNDRGNDRPFWLVLPTMAATAWYHKKLPQFNDLKSLLKEVEQFAMNDYATALAKGDALSADDRKRVIDKLSQYTGLSKTYIDQNNLRVYVGRFNKELLRSEGKTVGRLDSRFTGIDFEEAGESYEYDPSYNVAIYGPYTAAVNDYIRRILKYENDIPYEILNGGRVAPWSLSTNGYLNVAETLRDAMTKNPYLKVWVANGFYDMATPYFATQNVVDHMFLKKEIRQNLSMTYYEAGHMMYIHQPSLVQFKKDFDKFIETALPK